MRPTAAASRSATVSWHGPEAEGSNMSQFNAPVRRTSDIDVYTSILCVAFLVILSGIVMLALRNVEHSRVGSQAGGMFKLVE